MTVVISVIRYVTPCILIEIDCFGETCCLDVQGRITGIWKQYVPSKHWQICTNCTALEPVIIGNTEILRETAHYTTL